VSALHGTVPFHENATRTTIAFDAVPRGGRAPHELRQLCQKGSKTGIQLPKKLTYKKYLLMSDVEDIGHSCNIAVVESKSRLMTVGNGSERSASRKRTAVVLQAACCDS
jgi:hypothetical protein